MDLEPFGSVSSGCPKCGSRRISTHWHVVRDPFSSPPKATYWPCKYISGVLEHLCRICENCGYGVATVTKDAAGEPEHAGEGGRCGDHT